MTTVDVTVMGAGIFGLSVAYACARRGAKVQVIDPAGIAAGASGGLVGALAPHVPEQWNAKKAFQFKSLIMAEAYWAEVAARAGKDPGYIRSGRVQPLADDAAIALAVSRAQTSKDFWEGLATWEVIPETAQPWDIASPTGMVIRDTLSALIHPRRATQALAGAFASIGGAFCTDAADAKGSVVWATGWQGLAAMTTQHSRLVGAGVKGQAALLRHDARGTPQVFVDGLHIIPHLDGTVAIGSTSEREFEDPTSTDDQLELIVNKAKDAVSALQNAPVIDRWAGVRPRSRTRAPMLGAHPFRAGEFVANGGFKIGFGMAPKVGAVMADLVLEGRDVIPPEFRSEANL